MTPHELKCIELPSEHESDIREFQHHLHILQRQVMSRPARREMNNDTSL